MLATVPHDTTVPYRLYSTMLYYIITSAVPAQLGLCWLWLSPMLGQAKAVNW